jgi:hypothetical protein
MGDGPAHAFGQYGNWASASAQAEPKNMWARLCGFSLLIAELLSFIF